MAYDRVMFQVTRTPQVADVVIIGSGAGGGTATKVLTDLGINVTLIEAGPMLHPEADFLRRTCPLLRQGRGLHRRHRLEGRHPQRARWSFSNLPAAACARSADQESLGQTGDSLHSEPLGPHHQAAERASCMSFLWTM